MVDESNDDDEYIIIAGRYRVNRPYYLYLKKDGEWVIKNSYRTRKAAELVIRDWIPEGTETLITRRRR